MNRKLLNKLQRITLEERKYLEENAEVEKKLYVRGEQYEIDQKLFLEKGQLITIRQHTRFVDFPEHYHNYIEIVYVCQGKLTTVIDRKELCLEKGDILIMNPYVRHSVKKASIEDIAINFITLPEFFGIPVEMLKGKAVVARSLLEAIRQDSSMPHYLFFHLNRNREIDNLMGDLIYSIDENIPNSNEINQYTMGLVFLHLLNHLNRMETTCSRTYDEILVQTVLRYIDNCYTSATLSDIANELHQSVSGLSKIVKRETNHTFQELLQRKRFQQAVKFLVDSDLAIGSISEAVGYENYSYFYKQFKARYGATPNEYRQKYKDQERIRI